MGNLVVKEVMPSLACLGLLAETLLDTPKLLLVMNLSTTAAMLSFADSNRLVALAAMGASECNNSSSSLVRF